MIGGVFAVIVIVLWFVSATGIFISLGLLILLLEGWLDE